MDTFWAAVAGAPLVVLTDFDFTITEVDVGDLITGTLAPPSAEIDRRFRAHEIGIQAYWWDSMARVPLAPAEALSDTVSIDPGFAEFAGWCHEADIPLAVVSEGFSFYIARILRHAGLGHLPVFCNEMPRTGDLQFPHGNSVCGRCGCCKAGVARRAQAGGSHVIYIGDGISDLYGSGYADWVFAKAHLARHLDEQGSHFFPLTDFAGVQRTVAARLDDFRAGTAPGRSTVGPHASCRF